MMLERVFRGIAGTIVLIGALLTWFVDPRWSGFSMLVGVVMLQSGFTDRCPLIWALEKAGMKRCRDSVGGG